MTGNIDVSPVSRSRPVSGSDAIFDDAMNTFPATQQDAQQLPEQPHHGISCSNITTIPCLPSPSPSIHMPTVTTSSLSTLSPATSTALPLQTVDPAFFSSANAPNIVNSPISSTDRVETARLAKNPNKKEGVSINISSSSENTSDGTYTPTALQFQNHTPTTNSPNPVVSASTTQSQASASLVHRSSSTSKAFSFFGSLSPKTGKQRMNKKG